MKFRKKPVVIDAWIARELSHELHRRGLDSLPIEVREAARKWTFFPNGELEIPTLEGAHRAREDDFIIRGVKGEFYPCKPDIFAATYEAAE